MKRYEWTSGRKKERPPFGFKDGQKFLNITGEFDCTFTLRFIDGNEDLDMAEGFTWKIRDLKTDWLLVARMDVVDLWAYQSRRHFLTYFRKVA